MTNRRALVTGGAGFIGSHLVDALIRDGDEVVAIDNLETGHRDNVNPAARLVVCDVADPDAVGDAMQGVEVVYHLAAARAVLRSVDFPRESDRANTGGTLNILECARQAGARRVVSTSSSSVYGGAAVTPTPETAPLIPRSPYAVSKMAGENYARVYWELHRLETVSLRLFNVYGPRQRPESAYAAVIPLFVDALRAGRPPEVHGDGTQSRDFTFIDDTVAAFLAAGSAPAERCAGKVYNIAGGSDHSLLELLEHLKRLLNVDIAPTHTARRAGDVDRSRADASAAQRDLGWSATTPFDKGLAETVAWFTRRG
ncbi:MAG TPA: NAD-dependent epimerase/dehydratase family protein [Acidimicrobiales bacterium]|nr:NAD-dependent epimerase/dehydratase family protein [Acidimicrobiales bacterium]